MAFLSLLSAGLAAGSALYGAYESYKNYESQQANLDYQKQLQQTIFDREDNSVQRRAADLKAAGLSQTLAAGSGAGAGSVISTSAPQSKIADALSKLDVANAYINTKTALANQQQAQTSADQAREDLEYSRKAHSLEEKDRLLDLGMKTMDYNYLSGNGLSSYQAKNGAQDRLWDALYNFGRAGIYSKYGIDVNDPSAIFGKVVGSAAVDSASQKVPAIYDDYHTRYDAEKRAMRPYNFVGNNYGSTFRSSSSGTHSGRSGKF